MQVAVKVEGLIAAAASSSIEPGGYQEVGCRVGNHERKGQADDFLQVLTLAAGYYHQSTGDGWKPGMSRDPLQESVLTVTFQEDSFIETLRTDWG